MSHLMTPSVALCVAMLSPALLAQEPGHDAAAAEQMPQPKTEHHDALRAFVGRWNSTCAMEAMPGVPGMEKATTIQGVEHTELLCNGLFVRAIARGEMNGQPFEGVWLVGYDPAAKAYFTMWADGQSPAIAEGAVQHEAGSKEWTFSGTTPEGEMRSKCTFADADQFEETVHLVKPDGEELKMMSIARERMSAAEASATTAAASLKPAQLPVIPNGAVPAEQAHALRAVGSWDATVRMQLMPGGEFTEMKATETVRAICGGRWTWSDFDGEFMGHPFEGHLLRGWDDTAKQYVSYWIDSTTPIPLKSTGNWDEEAQALVTTGAGVDTMGQKSTSVERESWTDNDHRVLSMDTTVNGGTTKMEITYTRRK